MSTDEKRAWNAKYLKKFKQVSLRFLPEDLEKIKKAAESAGESTAGYITKALQERMNGENVKLNNCGGELQYNRSKSKED